MVGKFKWGVRCCPCSIERSPVPDGSSGDRAITIPGSPELGPTIGSEPERSESNEDDPAPASSSNNPAFRSRRRIIEQTEIYAVWPA